MEPTHYTSEEEARLRSLLTEGDALVCPRCDATMDRQDVHPRREVSYVRDRVLLICRGCRRSAVFDRRRL